MIDREKEFEYMTEVAVLPLEVQEWIEYAKDNNIYNTDLDSRSILGIFKDLYRYADCSVGNWIDETPNALELIFRELQKE